MQRQRIEVDGRLCRDCQTCVLACSLYHTGTCSPELARLMVLKDMATYKFDIVVCQQCDTPDCMLACPTEAMVLDQRGVVVIVDDDCIRCDACRIACPHGALFYHEATDTYLKCDLCAGRANGPLCIELCPVGALIVGAQHEGAPNVAPLDGRQSATAGA